MLYLWLFEERRVNFPLDTSRDQNQSVQPEPYQWKQVSCTLPLTEDESIPSLESDYSTEDEDMDCIAGPVIPVLTGWSFMESLAEGDEHLCEPQGRDHQVYLQYALSAAELPWAKMVVLPLGARS